LKRQKKYPTAQKQRMAARPCKPRFAAIQCFSCHRACFVVKVLQLDKEYKNKRKQNIFSSSIRFDFKCVNDITFFKNFVTLL
jgi:hypothetical protein